MSLHSMLAAMHSIPGPVGADIAGNAGFDDASEWTGFISLAWDIGTGGVATSSFPNGWYITQGMPAVVGQYYKVEMELIEVILAPTKPEVFVQVSAVPFTRRLFNATKNPPGIFRGFFRAWDTEMWLTAWLKGGSWKLDNFHCYAVADGDLQAEFDDILGLSLVTGGRDQYA